MKIKFVLLGLFVSEDLSKSVVTHFSVNSANNERSLQDELLKIANKNREYKKQAKNIFHENNELNKKIDNKELIINIKSYGLFFENKSTLSDQNLTIAPIIKKKIRNNAKYIYLKKMKLINKILEKYNQKSINEKFKKITFNKKRTHEALSYNLDLSEKLSKTAKDKKIKNRFIKINKILKKQIFLHYLNKKFKKSDVFATEFNPNKLESKRNFIKWVNDISKNANFDQIIQQAKRS